MGTISRVLKRCASGRTRCAIWLRFAAYNLVDGQLKGFPPAAYPKENYLPNLDAYRDNLTNVGFRYIRVEDSTEVNMNALSETLITRQERDTRADVESLQAMVNLMAIPITTCCMAYAVK